MGRTTEINSNEIIVDLRDIKSIKGWGWSNNFLGWLRVSNDSLIRHSPFIKETHINGVPQNEEINSDEISYGLYFVSSTNPNNPNFKGYIVGQIWNPNYGWLYFENYSNDKCPTSNISGQNLGEENCFAYVEEEKVEGVKMLKIKGWARFVNLRDNDFNPWVSLSTKENEPRYGLYLFYNPLGYYEIRGFAWNQNFGWISFGGQIIKKVEYLGIQNQKVKAKIYYTNFIPYKEANLFYQKSSNGQNYSKFYFLDKLATGQGDFSIIIKEFEPNTYYRFKLFSK